MNKNWLGRIVALAVLLTSPVAWGASDSSTAKMRGELAAKPAAKPVAKAVAKTPPKARPVAAKAAREAPARPSLGQRQGLKGTEDPLELKSSVALVVDQDTHEVLLSKNAQAVLPIASITKLMTALVVSEADLPLDQTLVISQADVDTEKGSRSRLKVGTELTRREMLHLALMSSENRAAHALGRYFPGGLSAFVEAMNRKAEMLGMGDTRFIEPTGLSSSNRSSANDLTLLVREAMQHEHLRDWSTSAEAQVAVGTRVMSFRNTNGLIRNPTWTIGLQKTGYISEAGRCVVMQAQLAGRNLIMVLLDSAGRYSRIGDAERIRRWLQGVAALPAAIELPRS
ncbi:MAG: serine hydrolase [Aquabacterium sp.]